MGQTSSGPYPGGWKVGDIAYYSGASHGLESGDALRYGARGEVVGESLVRDGEDHRRVAVKFPGNAGPVACFVDALRAWPPPEELAGGWKLGETAVYVGSARALDGDRIEPGTRVTIVGPAPEGGAEDSQGQAIEVAVLFPGHQMPVITGSLARDTRLCSGCEAWCKGAPERMKVVDIDASMNVEEASEYRKSGPVGRDIRKV